MSEEKIIAATEFPSIREKLRREHKTIVLCHGVFDLLHYGHVEHLREAKQQGDVLVVSVTTARYVNKGVGRPFFNDQQRMKFLASLEFVDYVLLSEAPTVHKIVEVVQPNVYVKGQEYADAANDVTGNIDSEREAVESHGGRIFFTQGEVFSSTKLLNNFFGALPSEVVAESLEMRAKYGENAADRIRGSVDRFDELKVLIVGDIIIDEYIFCKVQGLTGKDVIMSTRYDYRERYAGGSLAIARHVKNFVDNVTLLSMTSFESELGEFIAKTMSGIECRIVQERNFVTPVKTRYLKQNPIRQEFDKLFSVNRLLSLEAVRQINYDNLYRNLEELLPKYDVVMICDYGHGLLTDKAIRYIERNAKFLAVNCQTNSSNYGMNLITKYERADAFVSDERELRLAFGGRGLDELLADRETMLRSLAARLNSRYAWVTLGADGALGLREGEASKLSAVTHHVKDTVGAGDAFYSLAALGAASGLPIDQATLLGNIAGAIKTNFVGNSRAVGKVELLKFLGTVLNV